LEAQICEVTNIPVLALQQPGRLSQFTVDERMSWVVRRTTTIAEDHAYCLLGIFSIYMPLLYGEGKDNAFRRLRSKLKYVHSVRHEENINFENGC